MSDRLSEVERAVESLFLEVIEQSNGVLTSATFSQTCSAVTQVVHGIFHRHALTVSDDARINKLPAELLVSIFDRLGTNEVMACSHVCQWWRTTTLGNPRFWQNIKLKLPPPPMNLSPSLAEMLSRSQHQPIVLHAKFPLETTVATCASVAHAAEPHIGRLAEFHITMELGRSASVVQPMIDLLETPGSAPNLKSIDISVDAERGTGNYVEIPSLDHLESLVAYSVHGPVVYQHGMAPITPHLRAVRLLGSTVWLDQDEIIALRTALVSGKTLEQLALGTGNFYGPLARWLRLSGAGTPSPGGRLRYVFFPKEAIFGECDFGTLCRWIKARVNKPVHFALEGGRMSSLDVHNFFSSPARSIHDCGYIGHAKRLVASFLPHNTISSKVNVRFAGEDGENWFIPRFAHDEMRFFFTMGLKVSPRLIDLSIHEAFWERLADIEFPALQELTLFVGKAATRWRGALRPELDESDEQMVFLSIMTELPYIFVPNLRRFRIAAYNSHPVTHTVQPMDDQLRAHVQLKHPPTPVTVPAEAVITFIKTHLVYLELPLEKLVIQDIHLEGSMWETAEEGEKYAELVQFESTEKSVPAGWVPFVFSRDSDLCEMYCTQ